MTTCRIWIPSKQKYQRFLEMKCEQYRAILKSVDDDNDFDFVLNQVILQCCQEPDVRLEQYTIIDRFVLLLQLKIHSHTSHLKLTRICEKCQEETQFNIDLNKVIEDLATTIDKPFRQEFQSGGTTVLCDIPYVCALDEPSPVDRNDLDARLTQYLYSFIQSLEIHEHDIDLNTLARDQKHTVCGSLPFEILNRIKREFIDPIHATLKDLLLITHRCGECGDELKVGFDIHNMTDACRILFRDDSAINVLSLYANVSSQCHFDFNFYKNLTPAELLLIYNSLSSKEKPPEDPGEKDFLEEYRGGPKGMVESPSEFL